MPVRYVMGVYNLCLVPNCGGSALLGSDGRHVCSLCGRVYQAPEIYGDCDSQEPTFGWTHLQRIVAYTLWEGGQTWAEIGAAIGKRPETVRKYFQRNPPGDTQQIRDKIADNAMAMALSELSGDYSVDRRRRAIA